MEKDLLDFLKVNEVEYKENVETKHFSPIKIGGIADIVICPDSESKMISALNFLLENKMFKFKWIIVFPIFAAAFLVIYHIMLVLFHFINYSILGLIGNNFALILGCIFYIVLLFVVSVLFLSRKKYKN